MLNQLHDHVHTEMQTVLSLIEASTQSKIPLIQHLQAHALQQPGRKLIRPLIILLLAKAAQYEGQDHITLSAIIEMIHGATLLHDDVIDKADTRRNEPTAHKQFGTNQSILMGDYIYASAFKLIASLQNPTITHILAKATQVIVEGEILQLSLQGQITPLEQYNQIIQSKTALLFMTGAECIESLIQKNIGLSNYAYHFGMLYQITDDILDIDVQNTQLNKAHGTDLREGKMTLPTLLAYQKSTQDDQALIESILRQDTPWEAILPILEKTQALESCKPYLDHHLKQGMASLDGLIQSPYKSQLLELLQHIPRRQR